MWVQVPPSAQRQRKALAYIIGVALGDGNLSNPNGRAQRLRITCDTKYPQLVRYICEKIKIILPINKVSITYRTSNCLDICRYSNLWEPYLGWKWNGGSKYIQGVRIPDWIKSDSVCIKECLRGLFQTDGSIYLDRGYIMVNFVTIIDSLANDVVELVQRFGFEPTICRIPPKNNSKARYTIRISKNSKKFIKLIRLWKK